MKLDENEISMAKMLIENMTKPFVAEDHEEKELLWTPLIQRKLQLSDIVKDSGRIAVSRYIEGAGVALYKAAEAKELEGHKMDWLQRQMQKYGTVVNQQEMLP